MNAPLHKEPVEALTAPVDEMAGPELAIAVGRPWSIRLPHIYRTLEAQHVDAFFEDGSLRLSSFEKFRTHSDEQRRDSEEGAVRLQLAAENGSFAFAGQMGQRIYILCASTVLSEVRKEQAVLCIKNTVAFASEVSRQIAGFLAGYEGNCIYRDTNLVAKRTQAIPFPMPGAEANADMQKLMAFTLQQAIDCLFIKRMQFAGEAEYRLVWVADGKTAGEYLELKCPAARKFCERISK